MLADPELRVREGDDEPYVTDEGHHILDCPIPPGADLDTLGDALHRVPGVLEHGLFARMAEQAVLGTPEGGVEILHA